MSIVLKEGKTYQDETSAVGSAGFYGTVKELHRVNYEEKKASFWLKMHRDKAASEAKAKPVEAYDYHISGDVFDAVLGIDGLSAANTNIIKKLYEWLLTLRHPSTFTLDEDEEQVETLGALVWGDWEPEPNPIV